MITRNDSKPGEFLFIGGCADGERREIAQPYETIRVEPRRMCQATISTQDNISRRIEYHEYRLTRMNGESSTFFVYLYSGFNGDDMVKALIRRYTGAKQ